MLLQNAATRVRIVPRERIVNIFDRQPVVTDSDGIDQHLVLLYISSGRIDFRHAGNGAQQLADVLHLILKVDAGVRTQALQDASEIDRASHAVDVHHARIDVAARDLSAHLLLHTLVFNGHRGLLALHPRLLSFTTL